MCASARLAGQWKSIQCNESSEPNSLDSIVREVLGNNIVKSKKKSSGHVEIIAFLENQLSIEQTDAEKWRCNERIDGGFDSTGHHFVDGNLFLPDEEMMWASLASKGRNFDKQQQLVSTTKPHCGFNSTVKADRLTTKSSLMTSEHCCGKPTVVTLTFGRD